jgi:hypothetical protein
MINYRPISLPTTISKILEPVVFNRWVNIYMLTIY